MNKFVKVLIGLIVAMLVVVLAYKGTSLYIAKDKENNNPQNMNENANNVMQNNDIENNIVEENNTIVDEVVEPTQTEKVPENNTIVPSETENKNSEIDNTSDEEKAINIVKKDWGYTDGVVFVVESVDSSGKYNIAVRDAETRNAIAWYKVNAKTGEFTN